VPAVEAALLGDQTKFEARVFEGRDEILLCDTRPSGASLLKILSGLVSINGSFGLALDCLRRITVSLWLLDVSFVPKALSCLANRLICVSERASSKFEGAAVVLRVSTAGPSTCVASLSGLKNRTETLLPGGGQE
jgi:hypothetical protein